jgi:hypothetical protein
MSERGPGAGVEDPRLPSHRRHRAPVFEQPRSELWGERYISIGGWGLQRDTPGRGPAVGARELRPDVELAAVEIEVRPDQPQELGDPEPGVDRRGDRGPVARRAGDQEADDLVAAEDTLSARKRMGALPDVEALKGSTDPWPTLIAARHCAEAALDLSLAHTGFSNPNPKWRLSLALHAILVGSLEITPDAVVEAMLPDTGSPADSCARCVEFAHSRLRAAGGDPLIRSYPQYAAAADLFSGR